MTTNPQDLDVLFPRTDVQRVDIQQLAALAPLEPGAVEIYEYTTRATSVSLSELIRLTGRPEGDVAESVRVLLRLRLLRWAEGEPTRLTAVSPDSAELHVLKPAAQKVAELQEALAQVRGELSALSDLYHDGIVHRLRGESTEIVTGPGEVRARVDDLVEHAAREILVAQPGGTRQEGVPWESPERVEAALARGVRMRVLCQHTTQFSLPAVARVERVTALGAEVRTLGDRVERVLLVDGSVAVIPLRDDPRGAVLVRDLSTVDFMAGTFERLWVQGTPFPAKLGRGPAIAASDAVKSDIVRLLIAGEDDKAIARRMGMSVRTCQRHIAEIMNRLGARTRVRAGYLLRESGE
ncbi:LuxR C-terminal-related transcriptional regulator [Streptomyces sp. NPDC001678]|uniref:LuxR C-terminal-related transcriptional regulator n=1 Tax=Streptomyces sp. NPDC001678 TaxID=3364599 RepID=UPI003699EE39